MTVDRSTATPIKVGIIGLGKMGVMHCSMCAVVPGLEIAALVERDRKLGAQVRSMGVEAPFFASLEELSAAGVGLDAAVIATPQFTHRTLGSACLERGLHVLCEKPLAHTLDDARAMAEAALRHPSQVTAVAFMKGHYPLWLTAARRLHEGAIGRPRQFRAEVLLGQVFKPMKSWVFSKERAGGGVLINTGVHLLHFLTVLFGPPARVVSAEARSLHSNVEDTVSASLAYADGLVGSFCANWSARGYPTETTTVEIEGDRGRMTVTDPWLVVETPAAGAPERIHRSQTDRAAFNNSPDYGGEGWYDQMQDFADAIREQRSARYDWQWGLRVSRIADAIYGAAASHGEVSIGAA